MDVKQPKIMISYQWDSQQDVLKLHDALKKYGYDLWIDVNSMSGNIYGGMSKGIEESSIILLCMTSKYEQSESCNSEFEYAKDKKKKIIPIYLEKGYEASGSLGLIVAGKLYFDFTNKSLFESKILELNAEIESQLGTEGNV